LIPEAFLLGHTIMAHKEFHLRANEVRAESRALMLKLRTERLAQSRHSKKPLSPDVSQAPQKALSIKPQVPATSTKTAVVPTKPQSTIIVSRKVNAAVAPDEIVEPQILQSEAPTQIQAEVSEVCVETPVESLPPTNPVVLTCEVVAVVKPRAVRKLKSEKSKLPEVLPVEEPFIEALIEKNAQAKPNYKTSKPTFATILVESGVLEVTSSHKPPIQISSGPVDAPVSPKLVGSTISKPKPVKAKRALKPVLDVPVEGLGTVAELMEAVAASVRAPRLVVSAKTEQPVVVSGRALVPVSTVPSLGPGMIWRLNQIGVKTLADLASLEPDDLRSKLGPVAKLVRVESWIAFARAA
jgi:hypothetical protein